MTALFDDLFVFEMANNHQGSLEHALRIVAEMGKIVRRHRIRACVKLQYRDLDTFIHPAFLSRKDVKHIPRFIETRLDDRAFERVLAAVRAEGMQTLVTPFDEPSVALCLRHGVDILKVASCSATDWPLLTEMAAAKRPMIVSTGGVRLEEIDQVVSFLTHRGIDFALMHCVGLYPTPSEACHLGFIQRLVRRYPNLRVGWSGHEAPDNTDPAKIAVAVGARLYERHVGVATDSIKLNAYSMNPDQVDAWVRAILLAKSMLGDGVTKHVTQEELDSLRSLKRGVYARRAIKTGETITRADVFFAMPAQDGQLTSGEYGRYRTTYVASRDYSENDPVRELPQSDDITAVRSIIHDLKGMLYEAQIHPGNNVRIELSHHDGIQQFRRTGAAIVEVVNRSYCKKLILVLPGQSHPAHMHKVKEETFQLLWGDLEVILENQVVRMKPGDTMLVEPGRMHAFRSSGGAIFEEVSSTHRRNDSFYEDERIAKLDTMERKTIIEDW